MKKLLLITLMLVPGRMALAAQLDGRWSGPCVDHGLEEPIEGHPMRVVTLYRMNFTGDQIVEEARAFIEQDGQQLSGAACSDTLPYAIGEWQEFPSSVEFKDIGQQHFVLIGPLDNRVAYRYEIGDNGKELSLWRVKINADGSLDPNVSKYQGVLRKL